MPQVLAKKIASRLPLDTTQFLPEILSFAQVVQEVANLVVGEKGKRSCGDAKRLGIVVLLQVPHLPKEGKNERSLTG